MTKEEKEMKGGWERKGGRKEEREERRDKKQTNKVNHCTWFYLRINCLFRQTNSWFGIGKN